MSVRLLALADESFLYVAKGLRDYSVSSYKTCTSVAAAFRSLPDPSVSMLSLFTNARRALSGASSQQALVYLHQLLPKREEFLENGLLSGETAI